MPYDRTFPHRVLACSLVGITLSCGVFAAEPEPDLFAETAVSEEAYIAPQEVGDPRTGREKDDAAIVSLVWENDIITGRDQYYTNGFRASYLTPEARTPRGVRELADYLPFSGDVPYRVITSIGQNIYTPTTITDPVPDPNDRPYAGWLYGAVGVVSDRGDRLDSAQITVGMVGPASLAEPTQKFVHRYSGSPKPLGWDSQLRNEPGIILSVDRKWRSWKSFDVTNLGVDVTPSLGASVGNIETSATAGAIVRAGINLPQDYGPPRIRPSIPGSDFFIPTEKLGAYVFSGVEGRAVGRNIFLDGNTFRDSPSVDKNIAVGNVQLGMAVTYKTVRVSYTHIFETREFKGQERPAQYGGVNLAVRF